MNFFIVGLGGAGGPAGWGSDIVNSAREVASKLPTLHLAVDALLKSGRSGSKVAARVGERIAGVAEHARADAEKRRAGRPIRSPQSRQRMKA
jgi:hypothetical protein